MDLDLGGISSLFDIARTAWSDAGKKAPWLATSTWFALDDGDGTARTQVQQHLRHYMNWLPPALVDALGATAGFAGTEDELLGLLQRVRDLGTDEFHLVPTSKDPSQVERIAGVVSRLR
jgi:hypothetical protein